jgi:RHS repeat-associated protein
VKATVGGVSTFYLIDDRNPSGFAQVLEELTTIGSTPGRLYSYGLDLISQRQSNGATSFYGYDGNGNTRFLTSSNGSVSDTYAYDAFGTLLASTGTTTNNYLYTGEQYDPNLSFYYLRARYMNPATGRFWTRDSFEGRTQDPQSLHKYLYVKSDPINLTDPSGNDFGLLNIDISINLGEIINFATITVAEASKSVGTSLEFSPKNTTLGIVQRLLAAEVREPGDPAFDLIDSERGLYGVGAVIVNRVLSPKFPKTIEAVIKQHNQFAGFENYPTLPTYIENTVAGLQQFANLKGSKVLKYKLHMINLLYVANRVVNLDDKLDIFVPAGGPYIPTLFFRKAGSSNPWGGPARQLPEYRDTEGGNDFYSDRP